MVLFSVAGVSGGVWLWATLPPGILTVSTPHVPHACLLAVPLGWQLQERSGWASLLTAVSKTPSTVPGT